jgi:hypothetical protein
MIIHPWWHGLSQAGVPLSIRLLGQQVILQLS